MVEVGDNNRLVVNGKDEYKINRMRSIYVRRLGVRDQFVHFLACGVSCSAVSWAAAYWMPFWSAYISLLFFAVGLLWGLCTFRYYELRAVFKAVDETGDFDVAIARGVCQQRLSRFDEVVKLLSPQCA
ncbi:hypothetical protein [Pseudaeromonas paramecii]|uniref:Uncharacterized protein n=1 Tax=Pseudaeromonas paramecii TaxID=2138166 RepID=A0ABP8PXT5_9GAMM